MITFGLTKNKGWALALTGMLLCDVAHAQLVHVVTEDNPKLDSAGAGQAVVGPGADLVREVLRRADLQHDMHIYPWSRAYSMALAQENILIFAIGRTLERERKFKWVGEIVNAKFSFYKLKSRTDITLKKLDDARNYSTGVTYQDITHQFLVQKGFSPAKLDLANDSDQNFDKLLVHRMDLVFTSVSNVDVACARDASICGKIEQALAVDELNTPMYMAFSEATPDAIVARARKAYDSMRKDGTWARIMSKVK